MLRSLPRAAPSSSSLLYGGLRTNPQYIRPATICLNSQQIQQARSAGTHAISNPTLAGIEKRWEVMPPQEQADLWMALRDRMKVDWHELTPQEKKAGTRMILACVRTMEALKNLQRHTMAFYDEIANVT